MSNRDNWLLENIGIAKKLARRYQFNRVNFTFDDLENVAVIGMLKAYDRYIENDTTSLNTYAHSMAEGEIRNYIKMDEDSKKEKIHLDDLDILYIINGREQDKYESELLLEEILEQLNERDRKLLTLHMLEGYTFKEVGDMLSMSKQAVQQAIYGERYKDGRVKRYGILEKLRRAHG